MVRFVFIFVITALVMNSCQSGEDENSNAPDDPELYPDDRMPPASGDEINKTPHSHTVTVLSPTDSLLANPFDLYAFKTKKRGSLSGPFKLKDYHYKPDTKGIGYRFFMFGGSGIPETKLRDIPYDEGFVIKTFQPDGRHQHFYRNPDEILIELTARFNDPDLQELAFIGLDSSEIIKRIGDPIFVKKGCMIYSYRNSLLLLKLTGSKVEWLRYIRLKEGFDGKTIPEALYQL